MGRRENFYKTLAHEQPDDLILDLGGCPLSTMMGRSNDTLLTHLGIPQENPSDEVLKWAQVNRLDEKMLETLDIDTRAVGATQVPRNSQFKILSGKEYIDEWGIRRVFTGLYWEIIESPLEGASVDDLKTFAWPDPESIDREKLEMEAKRAKWFWGNTDYVICADLPVYGVFELGCWICGFEDYLIKMATDPDFIHEYSRRVLDYQKKITEIYYGYLGKYIHYTASGDDFATQTGLFVSIPMFQEMIKPYFKERIRYTREFTDAAYLHHSCGSVISLIDELCDCGVEILNPVQPGAKDMEPAKLKAAHGGKIVFHGGFDIQKELPFGTKESINEAVKKLIDDMYGNGGYIFAAAHNIQEDVPPENIVELFRAARDYGKKRKNNEI
jgi:uroporphyrinogen decarboxylase